MSRALRQLLLPVSLLVCASAAGAQEGVRIGLTYDASARPGLYVLPMSGLYTDSVRAILVRDLDFGDRINVIAPDSGVPPTGELNYPLYARLGAAAVLRVEPQMGGTLKVEVHEVGRSRVLQERSVEIPHEPLSPEWRMALHRVSDEIERWVTGTAGVAATRILFVRDQALWIVDSDGANERRVPNGENAVQPAWHPSGTMVAHVQYFEDGSHVVVRDLRGGAPRRVSFAQGSNITPAFSPDGKTIVFSSGIDGMDLWAVALEGGEGPRRVTVGRGSLNLNPSFAPDGRRLAFVTSRLGRPEIYITDADGANPEWLTTTGFGDQSYRSDPSWAPDNRHVAFQTQIEGRFQIATINLRDRSVRQHTLEGVNEQPNWAPDGRHLVFTSNRSGSRQLWVLDTESGRMRQLTRGGAARMGVWSPRIAVAQP